MRRGGGRKRRQCRRGGGAAGQVAIKPALKEVKLYESVMKWSEGFEGRKLRKDRRRSGSHNGCGCSVRMSVCVYVKLIELGTSSTRTCGRCRSYVARTSCSMKGVQLVY
eukprot:12077000-Prorocentrum_lima.AAC.1